MNWGKLLFSQADSVVCEFQRSIWTSESWLSHRIPMPFWLFQDPSGDACRRKLASFLADWISSGSHPQGVPEGRSASPNNGGRADEVECSDVVQAIAAARTAAHSLLPTLCFSSFIGYAVGFWPFVRNLVGELQKSWQWHRKVSATVAFEGEPLIFLFS